jgi:hypothetical protein
MIPDKIDIYIYIYIYRSRQINLQWYSSEKVKWGAGFREVFRLSVCVCADYFRKAAYTSYDAPWLEEYIDLNIIQTNHTKNPTSSDVLWSWHPWIICDEWRGEVLRNGEITLEWNNKKDFEASAF